MNPPRWLSILGIGEDGVEGLSATARALLTRAELVAGGRRHLALADTLIQGERLAWPSPIAAGVPKLLARRPRPVAVLASGDPFCFGVGSLLADAVPAHELLCIPTASSFSLACARLGWALQETETLSFCGRPLETLAPLLHPGARVLALCADSGTPAALAALLRQHGFGPSRITVLEALGGARERIRAATAQGFALPEIDALNLLAIEVVVGPDARIIPLTPGLADDAFEHDGQITKREIRAVTLAALAPRPGELLWDVGTGSGSVAIEWLLRHPSNRAIAVERRADRAARAARNAASLGVPSLRLLEGEAPDCLGALPPPDAVFVGGGAQREDVIETAWAALRVGGRMVANAVTIETEAALFRALHRYGGTLTRLGVERLDTLGAMHAFRPAMTVVQWSATKH
jgi:precorrin-6B C5,15-methyltransferase / cobalt-precorrin-6B C5,C15-methyltransferase